MPYSARDVVTTALRKLGVLRAGGIPSAADAEEGRLSLQSWYNECINAGTFGRVWDVALNRSGDQTALPNMHVSVITDDPVTITPPATVPWDYWWNWVPRADYGWGLHEPAYGAANVGMPRDKSVVQVTYQASAPNANVRATYLYDGTVQRWMRIDTLTLDDEAPLSARGFDGLSSLLALRLTDYFGADLLGPAAQRSANSYKMALVTNYGNGEDWNAYAPV